MEWPPETLRDWPIYFQTLFSQLAVSSAWILVLKSGFWIKLPHWVKSLQDQATLTMWGTMIANDDRRGLVPRQSPGLTSPIDEFQQSKRYVVHLIYLQGRFWQVEKYWYHQTAGLGQDFPELGQLGVNWLKNDTFLHGKLHTCNYHKWKCPHAVNRPS